MDLFYLKKIKMHFGFNKSRVCKMLFALIGLLSIQQNGIAQNASYYFNSVPINGKNSSAFGYRSLYSNTTGSGNIALGYKAGESLTTGNKNIIIGYDIDTPAITSTNMLNIGNIIYGTSLDGVNTTLSTGNIGIGTVAPGAKLEVA